MKKSYVIALDQGTTSSRAVVFNRRAKIVGMAQKEFTQYYPKPGWVEHDPLEILNSQKSVLTEVLLKTGIKVRQIASIGITNQRETVVVWDRKTGQPVYNAVVWQCRRTADICEALKKNPGTEAYIRRNTGLVLDAYFSGTKLHWILKNVPGARRKAEEGDLLFGTVDTWLIWNLTGGRVHVTDHTNASRTMLYNIRELKWDTRILEELEIPASLLPRVESSSRVYGEMSLEDETTGKTDSVPIAGIAGDQQAALFGQLCTEKGDVKNTYGTGCFVLMHTGDEAVASENGLLTTMACSLDQKPRYALEGSVFVGGAVIQWLRDELKIINDAGDCEYFSQKVSDTNGVYMVPAFVGLGSPHWDMYARGIITGLTRGVNHYHLIRAANESIAYQSKDVVEAMREDTKNPIRSFKVDGGAVRDNFLMQFQADILKIVVQRPVIKETTALGAAYLAGLAVGFWSDARELKENEKIEKVFKPRLEEDKREALCRGWAEAVQRTKSF